MGFPKEFLYVLNEDDCVMMPEGTPDYDKIHSERAFLLISNKDQPDLSGMQVFVVGANMGKDCRYFKEFGALEVHGLDVLDNTGADFQASSVYCHIESNSGQFNLQNMNQLPSQHYIEACKDLPVMEVILNYLNMEPEQSIHPNMLGELQSCGYLKKDKRL